MKRIKFTLALILTLTVIVLSCNESINYGVFTDSRDNQTYKYVEIGDQIWMTENFNYNAGDDCCCYNNNLENCVKYGRLYTWETAKKIHPQGWHLPSDEEWLTLINYLGGFKSAYRKIKESGTEHWQSPNRNANNKSGFTALPAGYFEVKFFDLGSATGFWTSSIFRGEYVVGVFMFNEGSRISRQSTNWNYKCSIRYIKDK